MGLIKTGLKAVVAVKTADVIHERIQRRQQEQWATYGHPAGMAPPGAPLSAAPGAAGDMSGTLAQLTQLGELRANGVLTDAEFEAQKARILNG
jgi:hypothetical protein